MSQSQTYVYTSPRAQAILDRKRGYTVDAEPDDHADDIQELKEDVAQLKEGYSTNTGALSELRGDHRDLEKRVGEHDKAISTLAGGTDDQMTQTTPKATEPDQVPSDDSVGGQNTYGPRGQVSGYSITSDLRTMNNKNRRKFGLDEITDGPTAANLTGKTGSISGNSSKTQQSLDLGQTWTGTNSGTKDAAVFRALAPDYYRRQQAGTTNLIRSMQGKLNKQYGVE